MNMTQSLWELVGQVSELLSDYLKLASKLHVSQNFSQQDHILSQLKVESTLLLEICTMMIGDGTFMIQLREVTGLEIKMPYSI